MAEPFVGEIRTFAFNFAPQGWAMCNGQTMTISQNTALFSLLGTTYGGNGSSTFQLPNLQSRVAIHMGQGSGLSPYTLGENGGVQSVALNVAQMPSHTHLVNADASEGSGTIGNPTGHLPGAVGSEGLYIYSVKAPTATMNPAMIANAGSGQAHTNVQPFLALNFCIALQGIFPARN